MKKCVMLVLILVAASCALPTNLQVAHGSETGKRIVTLSIWINFGAVDFDGFYAWFAGCESNYTFVLANWERLNSTQISWLKSQAELIPSISYLQVYDPATRVSVVDAYLNSWKTTFGSYPKGIFSFQPDTYIVNYTSRKYGIEYFHGTCFDQYLSDFMTQRGGWQLPYYANETHVLVPNTNAGGVVIFPHETWDWIASFVDNVQISTHPLWEPGVSEDSQVPYYVLQIINRTLNGVTPFGYSTFMFEYDWVKDNNRLWICKEIIGNLTSWDNVEILTLEDAANWFKATYDSTPTYHVSFQSPFSGDTIEWYYSTDCRIARVSDHIVSFVDYEKQDPDIYLTTNATIDWQAELSTNNDIDNSLNFTINALGGVYLKAPVTTDEFYYPASRSLANFPKYYYDSLNSSNEIISFGIFFIAFAIFLVAVIIAFRRKIKWR
jgi:hypothetical protein